MSLTFDGPTVRALINGWAGVKPSVRKLARYNDSDSLIIRCAAMLTSANENECWVWNGKKNGYGYGYLLIDGRSRIASRVVYKIINGDIPEDIYVLHSCDNPPCINPAHLHAGTAADNARERMERGRNAKHKSSYLSRMATWQSNLICDLLDDGFSAELVASEFNVTLSGLKLIANRTTHRETTI